MKILDKFPHSSSFYEAALDRRKKVADKIEDKSTEDGEKSESVKALNSAAVYFSRMQANELLDSTEEANKLLKAMQKSLDEQVQQGSVKEITSNFNFDVNKIANLFI